MGKCDKLVDCGGSKPRELMGNKMEVKEKLVRFFDIASLKCACCGKLDGHHIDKVGDVRIIRTPEYFGIKNIEGWERAIDEGFRWILSNSEDVLSVLPELREEWCESCKAVEYFIKKHKDKMKA